MASVVEVCNGALQKLGAARIVSLADNSRNARACNAAHERVRDRILRKHPWSFAVKRAELAASSTAPAFGPENAFPLPADYLRLLPRDPLDSRIPSDWRIESIADERCIVTNDDAPLEVRYVFRVTDPNKMDALFLDLWSTELALETCQEITASNTKKEGLREDKKEILAEARRTNAIEKESATPPETEWITARL